MGSGDRARFDVILGDKVSPGARSGAASVAALQKQLRALNADARSSSAILARSGVRIRSDFAAQARALRSLDNTAGFIGRAGYMSFSQWGAGARIATQTTGGLRGMLSQVGEQTAAMAGAMAPVAAAATGVATAFAGIAYEASGAYLSIARFREDSITSLRTVLGSEASAGRTFGNALVMANQTPLDPQDVIGSFTSFAVGGFGERELTPLAAAVADVQAARGNAAADSLTRVLTQIRGLGRVMRGDITMQGISAGLNAGDIFESIARQMNLGEGRAGIQRAEAMVSHGRVNDRIAIQAFLESVRKRYDRGANLGTFARNSSNTLTGAISNLRGAMFTLMAGLSLDKTPGVRALRDTVLAITGALDASSDSGRELRETLVSIANGTFMELFGGITKEDVIAGIRDMIPLLRGVGYVMRGGAVVTRIFVTGFAEMARWGAIGFQGAEVLFGGALDAVAEVERVFDQLLTMPDRMLSLGYDTAAAVLTGFTEGLLNSPASIEEATTRAFESAVDAARGALGWHSPSAVFRDAGEAVALGFRLGIEGGVPAAQGAVSQLVAPRAVAAPAGGTGGGFVFAPNVVIEGRGRSDGELVDMMMERLHDLFESMQLLGATNAPTR